MIKLIEEGYGKERAAFELVLAGSSVDDIYVIVLFYAFLGVLNTNSFDVLSVINIPLSITPGIIFGLIVGFLLVILFKHTKFNSATNVLITLGISFLMIGLENLLKPYISISSLLGIMTLGMVLLVNVPQQAKDLSKGYNGLWAFFEIILFVLVGATVDIKYALNNSLMAILVLFIGLAFITIGTTLCLIGTKLNFKERLFVVISYLPKATVQASIGGIALSQGLSCGTTVLTISVLAILISAPLGALLTLRLGASSSC